MLRKERIWNYMSKYKHKMQIKEERQKWEQRQQIGNSNKYGRCKSNYIKITLNSNSLNTPVERQRFSEWIIKQDTNTCCLKEMHFKLKSTYRL